jgi:filamentous hemagglutinin
LAAARITPGAAVKQNANGTYEAPVQIWDASKSAWIDKPGQGSTFFPADWSQARIEYEVSEAFKVGQAQGLVGSRFQATSPVGINIQFNWDAKNMRTTFYPLGQ